MEKKQKESNLAASYANSTHTNFLVAHSSIQEQKMNAEEMKKYAVVKFLSDLTFSEIPTAWLLNDGKKDECWWPPRTANSASLESARKSASDVNYQTTDEERLGRGKKLHIPCSRYSSSGNEEEEKVQL